MYVCACERYNSISMSSWCVFHPKLFHLWPSLRPRIGVNEVDMGILNMCTTVMNWRLWMNKGLVGWINITNTWCGNSQLPTELWSWCLTSVLVEINFYVAGGMVYYDRFIVDAFVILFNLLTVGLQLKYTFWSYWCKMMLEWKNCVTKGCFLIHVILYSFINHPLKYCCKFSHQ